MRLFKTKSEKIREKEVKEIIRKNKEKHQEEYEKLVKKLHAGIEVDVKKRFGTASKHTLSIGLFEYSSHWEV